MAKQKLSRTPQRATTRAAIYCRVSTEEQAKDGYGLDVQHERCLAMATVKGWNVDPVNVYTDAGISGTKGTDERQGLASLLAAVELGTVDAVIVLALDRLGRKTRLVLELVEQISNAGATLVSCKESLDTGTPQGQFVLTLFAGLAQLERDTIVERTTAGRNQRGKQDGEKGGRLPYGYVRTADGIAIDEQAASLVRYIFQLHRAKHSLRAIADTLRGKCNSPRGGTWYASGIREILKNEPSYRGGLRGESAQRWPCIL